MKKILIATLLVVCWATNLLAQNANNRFVGKYTFAEKVGEGMGGLSMMNAHQIVLFKEKGRYKAYYNINGAQTITRLVCEVVEVKIAPEAPANSLILRFESFGEEDIFKPAHLYKKGQTLLHIAPKGGLMASPDETNMVVTYDDEYPFEEKRRKEYIFEKQ